MTSLPANTTNGNSEPFYLVRPSGRPRGEGDGELLQQFGLHDIYERFCTVGRDVDPSFLPYTQHLPSGGIELESRFHSSSKTSLKRLVERSAPVSITEDLDINSFSQEALTAAFTLNEGKIVWPDERKRKKHKHRDSSSHADGIEDHDRRKKKRKRKSNEGEDPEERKKRKRERNEKRKRKP